MAAFENTVQGLPFDNHIISAESAETYIPSNTSPWTYARRDKRVVAGSRRDEAADLLSLLRVCARNKDLFRGASLHDEIVRKGLLDKCSDSLATMYAKCGALSQAKELLERHNSRNISSWTALIAAYTRQGQGCNALACFDRMQRMGLSPNASTFACSLKACASVKALGRGEQIYEEIARQGLLENDIVLGNSLVDMYAKCGALAKAQHVLEELPSRDVVSWNSLIIGYANTGHDEDALKCFEKMEHDGIFPDAVTFISTLKACSNMKAIRKGKQIHEEIKKQGLLISNDVVLGTALVDLYAKCGELAEAWQVLKELPFRNVITWNALISGYVQHGEAEKALECFEQMNAEGLSPDAVTFASILKACGTVGNVDKGKQIHDTIDQKGLLGSNISLGTALLDMYAKCGFLSKAQQVVENLSSRDVVCWNALIAGYAEQGQVEHALTCYERMKDEGIYPNCVTFSCILKACGSEEVDKVESICEEIERRGLAKTNIVLGTVLVDVYVKGGSLAKARRVLEELLQQDVVSWSTLIRGYVEQGLGEQALECFYRMQNVGLFPDSVTFACILKACGSLGAIDIGKKIHNEIFRQGLLESTSILGNALVDMYAKCGDVAKAHDVLRELSCRDVVSWSALIAGYAQQGQHKQVLDCLAQMEAEGVVPDVITLSSVLNVCCHLGLVEDACMYFECMSRRYGVTPDVEHYTCMADLLGRAGHLDKVIELIQEMPSSNYSAVWSALLGACQKWGDVNVAQWAFEQALQVQRTDMTSYVLMANIYAVAGMDDDVEHLEALRIDDKVRTKTKT